MVLWMTKRGKNKYLKHIMGAIYSKFGGNMGLQINKEEGVNCVKKHEYHTPLGEEVKNNGNSSYHACLEPINLRTERDNRRLRITTEKGVEVRCIIALRLFVP